MFLFRRRPETQSPRTTYVVVRVNACRSRQFHLHGHSHSNYERNFELEAFMNIIKQSVSKHASSRFLAPSVSIFQEIRSMPSSSKLFVGGLSCSMDDRSLREAFSQYGEVVEATWLQVVKKVMRDTKTRMQHIFWPDHSFLLNPSSILPIKILDHDRVIWLDDLNYKILGE